MDKYKKNSKNCFATISGEVVGGGVGGYLNITDTSTTEETEETNVSNPVLRQTEVVNNKIGRNKIKTNQQTYDLLYFHLEYILLSSLLREDQDP